MDGSVVHGNSEASLFTLMVYLNEDFIGDDTSFAQHVAAPKKGMALVFDHRLKHAGEAVYAGVKYVLRTDVTYREGA